MGVQYTMYYGVDGIHDTLTKRTGSSVLHFGPAHPAAHGVLRAILVTRGEWVLGSVLTLGLLHRGTEKLLEMRHVTTS